MDTLPTFDVVYSISDLHLGPDHALQPFEQATRLEAACRLMADEASKEESKKVALVLNGDVVDFLACPTKKTFDPATAEASLEKIAASFKGVFEAWASLTKAGGKLVVNLGNHDVELGLGRLQRAFRELLNKGGAVPQENVEFVFDGARPVGDPFEGYLCQVGGRRVRFVHGNEVDAWNVVSSTRLRGFEQQVRGHEEMLDERINAGSALVVEEMNPLKARYRFVDMLKPEDKAVAMVLLSLEPTALGRVGRLFRLLSRKELDALKMAFGLLGPAAGDPESLSDEQLGTLLIASMPGELDADALIKRAMMAQGSAAEVARREARLQQRQVLGAFGVPLPGLRRALQSVYSVWGGLETDRRDDVYKGLAERYDGRQDVLVAGHTHLRRFVQDERLVYINSGTWMPIIPLDRVCSDDATFERFYAMASTRDAAMLDEFKVQQATVVKVEAVAGQVRASLCEASDKGITPIEAGSQRLEVLR